MNADRGVVHITADLDGSPDVTNVVQMATIPTKGAITSSKEEDNNDAMPRGTVVEQANSEDSEGTHTVVIVVTPAGSRDDNDEFVIQEEDDVNTLTPASNNLLNAKNAMIYIGDDDEVMVGIDETPDGKEIDEQIGADEFVIADDESIL